MTLKRSLLLMRTEVRSGTFFCMGSVCFSFPRCSWFQVFNAERLSKLMWLRSVCGFPKKKSLHPHIPRASCKVHVFRLCGRRLVESRICSMDIFRTSMHTHAYPCVPTQVSLDLHGYAWVAMGTCGYAWIALDVHRWPLISADRLRAPAFSSPRTIFSVVSLDAHRSLRSGALDSGAPLPLEPWVTVCLSPG